MKGEGVYAYITLKEGYKDKVSEVETELKRMVKSNISGYAEPELIQFISLVVFPRRGRVRP